MTSFMNVPLDHRGRGRGERDQRGLRRGHGAAVHDPRTLRQQGALRLRRVPRQAGKQQPTATPVMS